jgi:hypothetical protein
MVTEGARWLGLAAPRPLPRPPIMLGRPTVLVEVLIVATLCSASSMCRFCRRTPQSMSECRTRPLDGRYI